MYVKNKPKHRLIQKMLKFHLSDMTKLKTHKQKK